MDQPAARKPQGRFWIAVSVALVLGAAALVGWFVFISRHIERAAARPWAALHEATVAIQAPDTAAAYYRQHPGLAGRFPSSEAFVSASRAWAPTLAELPPAMPSVMSLIRSRRNLKITSSGTHVTLSLGGRARTVRVVLEGGQLVDLEVQ